MEVKKLVCDVCGGQIEMQSGGKGVCTSCATPYSAEIIKDKIQEIRGTVKIDGPVEIVRGDAEKERLLKSAESHYSLGNYKESIELFSQVTEQYPDNFDGWFGLYKSTLQRRFNDEYCVYGGEIKSEFQFIDENESNYQNAKKFWNGTEEDIEKIYINLWKTIPFYEIRMPIYREVSQKNADLLNCAINTYIENNVKKRGLFKKEYVARSEAVEKVKMQLYNNILIKVPKQLTTTTALLFNGKSITLYHYDNGLDAYFCCELKQEMNIMDIIKVLENS